MFHRPDQCLATLDCYKIVYHQILKDIGFGNYLLDSPNPDRTFLSRSPPKGVGEVNLDR